MTHVNVGYRISDTAPKSLSVYSATSSAPDMIAGRSCGSVTWSVLLSLPCPRVRADSISAGSRLWNALLRVSSMYG